MTSERKTAWPVYEADLCQCLFCNTHQVWLQHRGAAFDRTLDYGKAGWVWGKFDFSSSSQDNCRGPVL